MEINDLEIDLQNDAGNNANKALTTVSLSDKEMSTIIGGGDVPNPTATGSAAPPAVPRPLPRVRLGRVWAE
ncbi:MAG TPA: hypothetical protein DEV81_15380 [Cyanobacteria bacterium UBA11049]|nr:hypothetical protein [Cyanobacteria bacterium UBA11049]